MRASVVKLGIFTVFTIFITVALATIIGNFSLFAGTYNIRAVFEDASGVLRGDLVKIAGVDVGRVTDFEIDRGRAIVTLRINDDVDLPANSSAEIKFRNLLGQRLINLVKPETPSSEALGEGDVIPVSRTTPPLDLSVVFNNLRPVIQSTNPEEINTVARAMVQVFEGREGDLKAILANLGELSRSLTARGGRLSDLVTDLNEVSRVLNSQSGAIRTGLGEFTEFTESVADVTPTIENVVDHLEDASVRFGRLLRNNRGNLDQELDDLATILGIVDDNLVSVDKIAKNLKEHLLATARSQSYGKWWTLYVVNLCPEPVAMNGKCSPLEGNGK